MKLVDSHCHLEDERFHNDLPETIARLREAGVERCILGGSTEMSCRNIIVMSREFPDLIYGVVGIHPQEAKDFRKDHIELLRSWLSEPNIIGIGEIGLDYYYETSPRDIQKEVLTVQLDIACEKNVPAVFHIRDAHGDMLELFRSRKGRLPRGVMHCFSGSPELAREYLDLGFNISFAGPLTFKNAAKLPEVAKMVPRDRFQIETDSPYLAPVPMRGKRNEPAYVRYVAEKLAEIWQEDSETVAQQAWNNTCALFGLEGKA